MSETRSDGRHGSLSPRLAFLLGPIFDGTALHPAHLADLKKSTVTPATIVLQRIHSVPPDMID